MATTFQSLFRSDDSERDNFLAKLFGIFSEKIARCWAKAAQAPYEDLGRPTIKRVGENKGHILDFTLRSKNDGCVYITEMKCELVYENYQYLTLQHPSQLDHHRKGKEPTKEAFRWFLDAALNPSQCTVTINRRPQAINGSILIWGSCTEQGRASVMAQYGFGDVLSLEAIINDLVSWQNRDYAELMRKHETWCAGLFTGLKSL